MNLYTSTLQTKYYLIPNDLDLPDGDFAIRSASGEEQFVAENAISQFEVNEEAIKTHLKAEMGTALDQVKESLVGSVQLGLAKARQEIATQREVQAAEDNQPEWLETLLGFTTDEIKDNSQLGEDWLQGVLDGVKTVLEGAASSDPAEQQAAREVMSEVRTRFSEAGIDTTERIAQLPDQLRDTVFNRDPQERADELTGLAAQLEQAASRWGTALRAEAAALKNEASWASEHRNGQVDETA